MTRCAVAVAVCAALGAWGAAPEWRLTVEEPDDETAPKHMA